MFKNFSITMLGCFLALNVLARERVQGTRVTIEPPDFLGSAALFSGYSDEEYGTSIIVTEMRAPISEIVNGIDKQAFAIKKMTLLSSEDVFLGENPAKLLKLNHVGYGLQFTKWMLIFGDESNSIIVVASFQSELMLELSEKLRNTILTVRWDRRVDVGLFEGLTFRISETESLKVAERFGNSLTLTADGKFPVINKRLPYSYILSSYSNTFQFDDRGSYARQNLLDSSSFSGIEIISQRHRKVSGLHGEIIMARGLDTKSNVWKFIHFSMLFTDNSYYIIQSIADLSERELLQREFSLLLSSFELISQAAGGQLQRKTTDHSNNTQ